MIKLTIETFVLLFEFVGTKEVVEAAKIIVEFGGEVISFPRNGVAEDNVTIKDMVTIDL